MIGSNATSGGTAVVVVPVMLPLMLIILIMLLLVVPVEGGGRHAAISVGGVVEVRAGLEDETARKASATASTTATTGSRTTRASQVVLTSRNGIMIVRCLVRCDLATHASEERYVCVPLSNRLFSWGVKVPRARTISGAGGAAPRTPTCTPARLSVVLCSSWLYEREG